MMKMKFLTLGVFVFLLSSLSCKTYFWKQKSASDNIELSNRYESSNTELENMIKPYRDSLSFSMDQVLNTSEVEMTIDIPEGNLGNFSADLTYEIGTKYYNGTIDFALLNNGGLRTSLPKGEITRKKVYELMPFENELVVLTLSKEKVIELFDFVANKSNKALSVKKGVPLSKQVKLMVKDEKVAEVTINTKSLSKNEYKVITSDYLAGGGDKMDFFLNPIKTEKVGLKLRDAIMEFIISEHKSGRTLNAVKDQRISYGVQ